MSETVFAADPTRLLIAALVRASVGAAVVAMTRAAFFKQSLQNLVAFIFFVRVDMQFSVFKFRHT